MNKERTLNYLKITRLAVITCAEEELLYSFFRYLFPICNRKYEKSLDDCEFEEYNLSNFSCGDVLVANGIKIIVPRKEVSQRLTTLVENENHENIFVPLKCEKYSELRSIYFHLPENVKSDARIFVLRKTDAGVKLECELGLLQGRYILYDYDEATGIFSEKN